MGCSFTWGQGLWYYSYSPTVIEDKPYQFNPSLLNESHHKFKDSRRFARLVADHFENDNEDVDVQLAQPDFESLVPYSVLGVPEQATNRQIKKTYFKLSKQYHPDRLTLLPNQQDAHNIFTLISNAYEFLMDPDKKGNMI